MGTEGSEVQALGQTDKAIILQSGPFCQHKSKFTVLNLGDYDVILGCPFQRYADAIIKVDDCL
eukprot:3703915-Rhodomonas_salina.1